MLLPYHQRGKVEFRNDRWRLSGGGALQTYMRIFGQEGLGRPDADAKTEINLLQKFLARKLDAADVPEVKALIVFTNDEVELDVDELPIPAMKLKKLKEFMRLNSKNRALSADQIEEELQQSPSRPDEN